MPLPNDNRLALGLVARSARGDPRLITRLLSHFNHDPCAILSTTSAELERAGVSPSFLPDFQTNRSPSAFDAFRALLAREEIRIITSLDAEYPAPLRDLYDPPLVLFVRGALLASKTPAVAVVGSRKITPYGQVATNLFVPPLVRSGITIISGLAYGCDAAAHSAALDAGGMTLAVLGSGIDRASIYPTANRPLAERIIANGGILISEFAPGTPLAKHHFPQRNRLIAALSQAIIVIEAETKSGSLITASFGAELGREVFAVPGAITAPRSGGTNWLIARGAHPALSADDVLLALGLEAPANNNPSAVNPAPAPADPFTKKILDLLAAPLNTDQLAEQLEINTAKLIGALAMLEIEGVIIRDGAGWIRTKTPA